MRSAWNFDLNTEVVRLAAWAKFAEQAADVEVAFAEVAGLALAGGLVVAGADTHPGGQTVGVAEGVHIGADFHEQHAAADQVDAGMVCSSAKVLRSDSSSLSRRASKRTIRVSISSTCRISSSSTKR